MHLRFLRADKSWMDSFRAYSIMAAVPGKNAAGIGKSALDRITAARHHALRHGFPVRTRVMTNSRPDTRTGGCHCGAVRFEVDVPPDPVVYDCNCSICRRTGFLHLIVPKASFRLLSGADKLETYTFNTGVAKHTFCRICGVKSFYVPRSDPDCFSVNLRCLEDGNIPGVRIRPFDGADWEQAMAQRGAGEGSDGSGT